MSEKKYKFTGVTEEITHPTTGRLVTLREIVALRRVKGVYGRAGGFIESERNLSQYGDSWVGVGARVYDNAVVKSDACVMNDGAVARDDALVTGTARVSRGIVSGNASVSDHARVYDHSTVTGHAVMISHATVCGDGTTVSGSVELSAYSVVRGGAFVTGEKYYQLCAARIGTGGHVTCGDDVLAIEGAATDSVTVHRTRDGVGLIVAGCQELALSLPEEQLEIIAATHDWRLGAHWRTVLRMMREVADTWEPVSEIVS